MRLSLFLLFVTAAQLHAGSLYSQRTDVRSINLSFRNATLRKVLDRLEKDTGFSFLFTDRSVDTDRKMNVSVRSKSLPETLEVLFGGTDVDYRIVDRQIILTKKSVIPGAEQLKKLTGVVRDEKGEPVIGASVYVKGTTKGVSTGIDGSFALPDVKQGEVIVISFIGYVTQEIVWDGKSVQVTLSENVQTLDEAVVTALGIRRDEKALGYAVQRVKSDDISVVKGVSVASSLTGKVAGLQVNNSAEISEPASLEIRGYAPLIVIDGVAYGNLSMRDISAEDIESMDILKGATASALYGMRGRGGAVMITTKKAQDGVLSVKVSNNTMFSAGYLRIPKAQHSYSTGNYGNLDYVSGCVWGDYMDGHEVVQYDPVEKMMKKMPLLPKGKNNVKNFFRNAMVTNTNVNISQAGKLGGFRLSATHVYQRDQYPNSKLNKYIFSGSGNINYNRLKLESTFSYKKETSPNMPITDYGNGNVFYNLLIWSGTEFDIRDFKDYWKVVNEEQNWFDQSSWYDNPYFIMNEIINKTDRNLFNVSLNLSYSLLDNLKISWRSGYDKYDNNTQNRYSKGATGNLDGRYEYDVNRGESFNNDLIVNGDFSWKDFNFKPVVGGSIYWYRDEALDSWTIGGLSIPGFYSLKSSVERPGTSKSESEKAVYSLYGKLDLSWKNGIFVALTGRNDWSSTLPSSSRSYFYPSVSFSFLPTAFYNPIDHVLDLWKLRGSWTVYKKDLGVYSLNSVYGVTTDRWNGLTSATYPTTIKNSDVKPEKEVSWEFGTGLKFFKGRLSFDYTYFTRLWSDGLISASVSQATGFNSTLINTQEEQKQKGMEFTLSGKPVSVKDFTWESTVNASFSHWYYHKMDPEHSTKDPRLHKGVRTDNIFTNDWVKDKEGNLVLRAGLPIKNEYETIVGYSDPKCIVGWMNTFKYKNWNLGVSFDGRFGGKKFSWTEQAMWNSGTHPDSDNQWRYDEVVNKKHNYVARGVKVVSGEASFDPYGNVLSDTRKFAPNDVPVSYESYIQTYNENAWDHWAPQNIWDASFIKLREVALNYTFSRELLQNIHLKDLQIGIIGQNLFMWSKKFKYSDPERSGWDGNENMNSPTSRYLGININITL